VTEETKRYRGQRGPGKRPAMTLTNLRLRTDVLDFYKTHPSYTAKMREVLTEYAEANKS
jgi:uncharacterized protein (DUF4415 family)